MRIGSLFSGACDGLSLGLEWAGLGPTIWQVEIEDDFRRNLERNWPSARRFGDVRTVGRDELDPVEIVVASPPCQDLSVAGRGGGLGAPRSGLWFEALRIVGELRPTWVVVENVASGASRWVGTVRRGLLDAGYESVSLPIAAADVGAPHLRRRIFVLAHLDRESVRERSERVPAGREDRVPGTREAVARLDGQHEGWPTDLEVCGAVDGFSGRLDGRTRVALGNAVVPQCAEVVGYVLKTLRSALDGR